MKEFDMRNGTCLGAISYAMDEARAAEYINNR